MNKFHVLTHLDEKWPLALDFDQKVKVWLFSVQSNFDQLTEKIHLSIQWICDILNLVNRSRLCHWVLESILEPNLPLARLKIRNCLFSVKNPNFDHFALLMIWSNFLRSCGPNLTKWYIWVHIVDIGQNLWSLTVN